MEGRSSHAIADLLERVAELLTAPTAPKTLKSSP